VVHFAGGANSAGRGPTRCSGRHLLSVTHCAKSLAVMNRLTLGITRPRLDGSARRCCCRPVLHNPEFPLPRLAIQLVESDVTEQRGQGCAMRLASLFRASFGLHLGVTPLRFAIALRLNLLADKRARHTKRAGDFSPAPKSRKFSRVFLLFAAQERHSKQTQTQKGQARRFGSRGSPAATRYVI